MNRRALGFTLLESMIALLVLSLGMLGAWSMLLASLQSHADALCDASALRLVQDMAGRIRANPHAGHLYDSDETAPASASCDALSACDVAQLAAADLQAFADAAQRELPGTQARASVDFEPAIGSAAADRFAITLRWRGTRDLHTVTMQWLAPPVAGGA
jgi:type IV pilus assembly protein PilV